MIESPTIPGDRGQAVAWSKLWVGGYGPERTSLERHLKDLVAILATEGEAGMYRFVLSTPGYQQACNLWMP